MKTCADVLIVHPEPHEGPGSLDLSFLEGKRVVSVGVLDQEGVDSACRVPCDLAIDYDDGGSIFRVVLCSDRQWGLCVSWKGELGKARPEDVLRQRIMDSWPPEEFPVEIRDVPLDRRYSFVAADGREMFSLSIADLRLMGQGVSSHFSSSGRDGDAAIGAILAWATK